MAHIWPVEKSQKTRYTKTFPLCALTSFMNRGLYNINIIIGTSHNTKSDREQPNQHGFPSTFTVGSIVSNDARTILY